MGLDTLDMEGIDESRRDLHYHADKKAPFS